MYRRAQAYYNLKQFDEGLADCKRAAMLDPENKAVVKLQKQVQVQVDAMLAKEKAFYGKMFG